MEKTTEMKKISRRIILFIILLNGFAWAGWLIARDGSQDALDLGNLIWLISPFILTLLFRLFTRDWKDFGLGPKFKGNMKWYGFSLVIFPILISIVLLFGWVFMVVSFEPFNSRSFQSILLSSAGFLFIKNIFEEGAWRGYLTPKLEQVKPNRLFNHVFVGLIWGTWHIPYYLGLLDASLRTTYTTLGLSIFIPLIIFSMIIAALLFGELRLITNSFWPAVLAHTASNLVITTLLLEKQIEITESWKLVFTPSWEGVIMLGLLLSTGVWLRKKRM